MARCASHPVVMENYAGAIRIRMVNVMSTIAKPFATPIRLLPRWTFPRLFTVQRRRRQATMDLIHSSPHLLRDIGATEEHVIRRQR